jgi:hypothetical protein
MEVCFLVSGVKLAVLAPGEFEGRTAKSVKQTLAARMGITRIRQRLFSADGCEIPDEEIFASDAVKINLVILEFCPLDAEQSQRYEQLLSAVADNDLIEVEKLKSPLNPNVRDEYGRTPLHSASSIGHVESLQLLLEAGAKIDEKERQQDRMAPLHLAAQNGHLDVVRHLVEVGADKEQRTDPNGATPCWLQLKKAILMLCDIWWTLVLKKIKLQILV